MSPSQLSVILFLVCHLVHQSANKRRASSWEFSIPVWCIELFVHTYHCGWKLSTSHKSLTSLENKKQWHCVRKDTDWDRDKWVGNVIYDFISFSMLDSLANSNLVIFKFSFLSNSKPFPLDLPCSHYCTVSYFKLLPFETIFHFFWEFRIVVLSSTCTCISGGMLVPRERLVCYVSFLSCLYLIYFQHQKYH